MVGVASISSGPYLDFSSSSELELLSEASLVIAVVEPRERGRKAERSLHTPLARGESRFIEETVDCLREGIFIGLWETLGDESGVD